MKLCPRPLLLQVIQLPPCTPDPLCCCVHRLQMCHDLGSFKFDQMSEPLSDELARLTGSCALEDATCLQAVLCMLYDGSGMYYLRWLAAAFAKLQDDCRFVAASQVINGRAWIACITLSSGGRAEYAAQPVVLLLPPVQGLDQWHPLASCSPDQCLLALDLQHMKTLRASQARQRQGLKVEVPS